MLLLNNGEELWLDNEKEYPLSNESEFTLCGQLHKFKILIKDAKEENVKSPTLLSEDPLKTEKKPQKDCFVGWMSKRTKIKHDLVEDNNLKKDEKPVEILQVSRN